MMKFKRYLILSSATLLILAGNASASIVQITQSAFQAGSGLITFSEVPLGTQNPVYTPSLYGGTNNEPTVKFGGYYVGQSIGNASTCTNGQEISGCVVGKPTGPLTLSPNSPATFTASDGSDPTSPALSGSPLFNGPISMTFSVPVAGVGLAGGYFDALNSTAITAYDANGNVIGSVTNSQLGYEFLGLVTSDGSATISGLQFSLVGPEPEGFDIDNLRFGLQGQVTVPGPGSPEPGTFALLVVPFAGLLIRRLAKRSA